MTQVDTSVIHGLRCLKYQKDVEASGVFQGHMKDGSQQGSDDSATPIVERPALPFGSEISWTQHGSFVVIEGTSE